jgi:hypothetical protein
MSATGKINSDLCTLATDLDALSVLLEESAEQQWKPATVDGVIRFLTRTLKGFSERASAAAQAVDELR